MVLFVVLAVIYFFCIYSPSQDFESRAKIIQVQDCVIPNGMKIIDLIKVSIAQAESEGNFFKDMGWLSYPDFEHKGHRVIFEYNESDVVRKAEWIAKERTVEPFNQLGFVFSGQKRSLNCKPPKL